MDARIQDLPFDPAALHGLPPGPITRHPQRNCGGAVKRLNAIRSALSTQAFATAPGFQLNGLEREEPIATHSMQLHELYFGSLGGDGVTMEPAMKLALDANFGSVERWREQFVAMGKALGGGSGWVLLVFQPREGSLVNRWAADHTHAVAVHAAGEPFGAAQDEIADAVLLDGRRAGVFEQAASMLPGARWSNPATVATWASELPADRWQAAGRPTQTRGTST